VSYKHNVRSTILRSRSISRLIEKGGFFILWSHRIYKTCEKIFPVTFAASYQKGWMDRFQIVRKSGSSTGKEKNISISVPGFAAWDLLVVIREHSLDLVNKKIYFCFSMNLKNLHNTQEAGKWWAFLYEILIIFSSKAKSSRKF
jgi:hypothetical protein